MTDILDAAQQTSGPTPPAPANPSLPQDTETPTPPPTPSPIEPSALGETNKSPADSDVMDALLSADQESSSLISPIPPVTADNPKVLEPPPKKKGINLNKGVILTILLLLFVTLPLVAYYASQQRRVAEIRSRASEIGAYPGTTPGKNVFYGSCASQQDVCVDQTHVSQCIEGRRVIVPSAPNECTNESGLGSCTGKTPRCTAENQIINTCGADGQWEPRPAQPGECDQSLPSVSCIGLSGVTICPNGVPGCTTLGFTDCWKRTPPPGQDCIPATADSPCTNSPGIQNYCDSTGHWKQRNSSDCGSPATTPTPDPKVRACFVCNSTAANPSVDCKSVCDELITPPATETCPTGQWYSFTARACTPIFGGLCDGIIWKQITCSNGQPGCQNPFLKTDCDSRYSTTTSSCNCIAGYWEGVSCGLAAGQKCTETTTGVSSALGFTGKTCYPGDQLCDTFGTSTNCKQCTSGMQCVNGLLQGTGNCVNSGTVPTPTGPKNDWETCSTPGECKSGICGLDPADHTHACLPIPTSAPSATKLNDWESCSAASQCKSGICGRDPGDNTPACLPTTTPAPQATKDNGETCVVSTECKSGICGRDPGDNSRACLPPALKKDGELCNSNGECKSGICGRDPGDNSRACLPSANLAITPSPIPNVPVVVSRSGCGVQNNSGQTVQVCTFSGGCEGNFDGVCGPSWGQISAGTDGAHCKPVLSGGTATCDPAHVSCGSWQVDVSVNGKPQGGIAGVDRTGCTTPGSQCTGQNCGGTGGGGGGGGGTPPPSGGQCNNIQVYKNRTLLTAADLAKLKPGDNVNISVIGTSATQGRVRVNGGDWAVSTTKDANGGFTVPFTVPPGTTSFTIEGQLFVNGAWQ